MEFLYDGRAYMPFTTEPDSDRRMPCWFMLGIESHGVLRVRTKADPVGWTVTFVLHGDSLELRGGNGVLHLCTRAREDEVPSWLREDVAKVTAAPPP